MNDSIVQALLRERYGYKMGRRFDRMRQVDIELARYGIAVDDVETAAGVTVEKAVAPRARKPRR